MSNYVKSTNFTAKDSLPTGDANKVIRGSEFDTEFDALQTAVGTKADLAGPTFTGTATFDGLTATGTVNFTGANVSTNIDGGTIDGVTIGGTTPGAGTFSSLVATTADINAGTIDNAVIGGSTPAAGTFTAVAGTTGTFSGAVSGTTGTFSGAVTGSNLNIANWDTAFGWGNHASAGYLTNVGFSDIDAGAITLSSETFVDSDTQIPTNAAVIDYVAATIPLISEINDLTASVTWADVPNANITQSSVTQHEAALSIAATQLTGNITVPGNVYLAPSGTGFTELRGNTNAGAIRFNCEVNTHGVTLKGPPHSASATYELELPDADGSAGQFLKTDGSGKLSFDTVSVNNISGDVTITGELLADSYNEKFKRVSSVATTNGYQLGSAAYDSKSFSVASQVSVPKGLAFNGDGTKMFVADPIGQDVNEYTLSTGYDVSTASFVDSFSVSSQESYVTDLAFNSNGTKMFIVGSGTDAVYEYDLSTGFDVSTASYNSVSLSVSSQDTAPEALTFSSDGTKMYVGGESNDTVFQYTLTTAFDLSTASYASKSFSVVSQENDIAAVQFSSDGTKMFIIGATNNTVYQYNLSTAYDVSTASYSSTSFAMSQDTSSQSLAFSSDGTKLYMGGNVNDTIYQYSTSATTSSTTFDCENANVFETELDANTTVVFSNPPASGTPVVTASSTLSDWSYDSKSFTATSQGNSMTGIEFNSDGTKMYLVERVTADAVFQYSLSTAYDVSTASYDSVSLSISTEAPSAGGMFFKTDGTSFYVICYSTNAVYQYDLTTAWDLSTASYASKSFNIATQANTAFGVAFKTDGTKMYVLDSNTDDVFQYSLSTAWDVSTASYDSVSLDVTSQTINPTDLVFSSTGQELYICHGESSESIFKYNLTTAWDLSTASYSSTSFSTSSQNSLPAGLRFGDSDKKLYVLTSSTDEVVYQYSTSTSVLNDSTAYGMSLKVVQDSGASGYTVTWPTSVDWPNATAPTLTATASAVDQFVFYTYDGGTTWYGFTAGQALA